MRSSNNAEINTSASVNALNTDYLFESDNEYGIPNLKATNVVPDELVPFSTPVRRKYAQVKDKCVHFFLDDYQFESLWSRPYKTLAPIQYVGTALSPDFSLFTNYPRAMQIWNVYRSRWLARYWQECGVEVIPTVSWSDESSFDFCFLGIPKKSVVALGTVGINSLEKRKAFTKGFEEMLRQIEPSIILVYGETSPVDFEEYGVCVKYYESYWKQRRRALNENQTQE